MIGMPDREKISGFELCVNGKPCIGEKFTQCPFSPRNNDEQNCGVTMARFALALLKEQGAVEPIYSYGTFRCGSCRNIVGYNDGYGRGYQNNFCSDCGRKVKWE